MPIKKSKTFTIFPSFGNIYIEAQGAVMDEAEITAWGKDAPGINADVSANNAVIVFHPYSQEHTVSVTAEIFDTEPPLDKDHWDHIVEASLKIDNGIIQIWDGFPEYREENGAQFTVQPGTYRTRIHFGNLKEEEIGADEGDDHYLISIWPAPIKDLIVVKQWPVFLKTSDFKAPSESYAQPTEIDPAKIAKTDLPIWHTIELGTYASVTELTNTLTERGYKLSSEAKDLLKQTTIAPHKTHVDLIVVTAKDLGLMDDPENDRYFTMRQFYEAAQKAGYDLVPAEVGPQLRLEPGLSQDIASPGMEPLRKSDGKWGIFEISDTATGKWLLVSEAGPNIVVTEKTTLLFTRR